MSNPTGSDLVEDMFGLNLRGLKTIWDTFVRPADVFAAARLPDWGGQYTPSIRLVFSLGAVLGFFSFFWAGENSYFFQSFAEGLRIGAEARDGDADGADQLATEILSIYSVLLPFSYIVGNGIIGLLFRVWGRGTSAVVRLRLHMIAVTPSIVFSLISTLVLTKQSEDIATFSTWASALIALLLSFVTSYRGGVVAQTGRGRVGKAFLFSLASLIASALAGMLAFLGPVIYLGFAAQS